MLAPLDYAKQLTHDAAVLQVDAVNAVRGTTVDAVFADDPRIAVFDSVLSNPVEYARQARLTESQTYVVGDVEWHGLSACAETAFVDWLFCVRPDLTPSLSLIRRSPLDQVEPNYIHTDRDMGDWTAILYLTEAPDESDGTDFWRHRWSGVTESCASSAIDSVNEGHAWRDLSQWALRAHVPAVFNRAIIFPASCFHSRAIYANYGVGNESRLTQVVFCKEGVSICHR